MSNNHPKIEHLKETQWKQGQSGNPNGKPKGSKNLSTWIKELLNDETFPYKGLKNNGTIVPPIQAIVKVLIIKAIEGDIKSFELLARYGYGTHIDSNEEEQQKLVIIHQYERSQKN